MRGHLAGYSTILRRCGLAVVLVCTVCPPVHAVVELPNIGDSSETVLSIEQEQRLGEAFMRSLRQSLKIVNDPEVDAYIQTLGYRLVAGSETVGRSFNFFVVQDSNINAFAGPGGYIGINSGLVLTTESEDELASVIAHEVAHVTQRHLARTFEAASKMSLPMTAAVIAAIILGSKQGQLGGAALAAATAGNIQSQINFTRDNEKEADRVGIQILASAGYDPRSMPLFFERLQRATRGQEDAQYSFLQTHPVTHDRIADTLNRAEQYHIKPTVHGNSYELIKAKLRVITDNDPQHSVLFFSKALEGARDNDALRYGLALALLASGQQDKARAQIEPLIRHDPDRIAYEILLAQIELSDGHVDKGLKIYQRNLDLYPHNQPLTMLYAQALLRNDRPEQAKTLISDYMWRRKPTPELYTLLAQADTATGRLAEAHQDLSEYYYLTGNTAVAIEQLNIALRYVAADDNHQLAKINARLAQFKEEYKQEKKRGDSEP
jgi:predicted Zn-dependent protease